MQLQGASYTEQGLQLVVHFWPAMLRAVSRAHDNFTHLLQFSLLCIAEACCRPGKGCQAGQRVRCGQGLHCCQAEHQELSHWPHRAGQVTLILR